MSKILNAEIKAKANNIDLLHQKLIKLGAEFKGIDNQVDTYFNVENGRLKLRSGNIENSLIFYRRIDKAEVRESEIFLEKLPPENNMKNLLSASNGVLVEVVKARRIYFINNVKFHLDTVEGLGEFVEIEAIDESGKQDVSLLQQQCSSYVELLGLEREDFLSHSYSDLIMLQRDNGLQGAKHLDKA